MKWKKTPPKRETGAGGEGVREISERQEEGWGRTGRVLQDPRVGVQPNEIHLSQLLFAEQETETKSSHSYLAGQGAKGRRW